MAATATRNGNGARRRTAAETVCAIVENANDGGLKAGGTWFNFSKFMTCEVPELAVGDQVVFTHKDGWISQIRIDPFEQQGVTAAIAVDHGRDKVVRYEPQLAPAPATPAYTNGANGDWRKITDGPGAPGDAQFAAQEQARYERQQAAKSRESWPSKDRSIVRQVCVKAAAEAWQPTGGETPKELANLIIGLAIELETWILQA